MGMTVERFPGLAQFPSGKMTLMADLRKDVMDDAPDPRC